MNEFAEPQPLTTLAAFETGDFHALSESCAGDPQYNEYRLALRRKLLALAKAGVQRASKLRPKVALEARTSLHHPHAFNRMRVRRMWAYITRDKPAKNKLKRIIGPELGKDLDAAYRNAFLCLALEADAIEVSLRIHEEAWYDGQNLVRRLAQEGLDEWLELLNQKPGYRLQLADWKGEWLCGSLTREKLKEFLGYYKPGEHSLAVIQRHELSGAATGGPGWACEEELPERLLGELMALLPLYVHGAWSTKSNFL